MSIRGGPRLRPEEDGAARADRRGAAHAPSSINDSTYKLTVKSVSVVWFTVGTRHCALHSTLHSIHRRSSTPCGNRDAQERLSATGTDGRRLIPIAREDLPTGACHEDEPW